MTHALLLVSMGVEARCHPSKSTAHCCHMKRQPFLCNGHPCRGHRHCHRRCHLCHHCRCRHHCRRRCRHNRPLLSPLPSAIAVVVAVNHPRRHLCCIAVSHHCCHHPCCQPLPSPSPLAIAVAVTVRHHRCHAVGHFWSCCLGTAKIVFNQSKQRMLTLFYFVQTVGNALIKAK